MKAIRKSGIWVLENFYLNWSWSNFYLILILCSSKCFIFVINHWWFLKVLVMASDPFYHWSLHRFKNESYKTMQQAKILQFALSIIWPIWTLFGLHLLTRELFADSFLFEYPLLENLIWQQILNLCSRKISYPTFMNSKQP